tara:strand:+ start:270 stop:629 length:360 start_codon:yes stop_codon:yes gene_type:complete
MCDSSLFELKLAVPKIGLCEATVSNTVFVSVVATLVNYFNRILAARRFYKQQHVYEKSNEVMGLVWIQMLQSLLGVTSLLIIVSANWVVILCSVLGTLVGVWQGWKVRQQKFVASCDYK